MGSAQIVSGGTVDHAATDGVSNWSSQPPEVGFMAEDRYDQAGRKLLTQNEEIDLANRFQREGSIAARNDLVLANSGLAYQFARRESRRYDFVEEDDLVQEAFLGVIRACEKFNPRLGYRFSTYCSYWIRAKISRRVMVLQKENNLPIPGASMREDGDGRRNRPRAKTISTELEIRRNHESESMVMSEMIPGMFEDQESAAVREQSRLRIRSALDEIFSSTRDPRVKVIICERMLTDDPVTLDELGVLCGVSREGARLIEKRVFKVLRERLNY